MLMVDRSASPYAGLRSASVRESADKRNHQQLKLYAKPSKHPLPPPRSGFVQQSHAAQTGEIGRGFGN